MPSLYSFEVLGWFFYVENYLQNVSTNAGNAGMDIPKVIRSLKLLFIGTISLLYIISKTTKKAVRTKSNCFQLIASTGIEPVFPP